MNAITNGTAAVFVPVDEWASAIPRIEIPAGEILAGHQPAYLPWCGYLSRLLDVGRFLVLDHVDFSGGWQNRNYLASADGTRRLVTVPVHRRRGQPITDTPIAGDGWRVKHWRYLEEGYRRAEHWPVWQDRLAEIYQQPWERLIELNLALFALLCEGFGIEVELMFSSRIRPQGRKTAMLIDLCERTGSRALRVGKGATYLDERLLIEAGVSVQVATYVHPPYRRGGRPFTPNLSALDLLLHCGGEHGRQVLAAGARLEWKPLEGTRR